VRFPKRAKIRKGHYLLQTILMHSHLNAYDASPINTNVVYVDYDTKTGYTQSVFVHYCFLGSTATTPGRATLCASLM